MNVFFLIKRLIIVIFVILLGFSSEAKTVTINPNKPLQKQFSKESATYKIKATIDLQGETITLPKNSILKFKKKGIVKNGALTGNYTKIVAKEKTIIDNISINGDWHVPVIYLGWMPLSEDDCRSQVQELVKLQSSGISNIIYTPDKAIRWTPKSDSFSLIDLQSNATLIIRDTIYTNGNNRPYYRVVNAENKCNIQIQGGVLVGDVESHIYDGTSSHGWGFGVNIEGCENVEVNRTTAMLFTGDGFYFGGEKETYLGSNKNGCRNITLRGVRSLSNRRQGMSVTGATDHFYVYDSEFSYTGEKKLVMPGAGVDFEVNYDSQRITDVYFNNCTIQGNRKGLCLLNKKGNGTFVFENVRIESNPVFNKETQQYDVYPFHCVLISGDYEAIKFENCDIGAISNMTTFNQELPNIVSIDNCTLSVVYTRSVSQSFLRSFKISNSTFDIANKRFLDSGIHDTEEPKEIVSLLYCASIVDFDIDNCKYITGNTSIKSGFSDTDRNASICIRNSTLDKEEIFPHANASFYNCVIKFPTYRWLALRKGMTSVWEGNTIEITEPASSILAVTQIRGEGTEARFIFKNNKFVGNAANSITVPNSLKPDCRILWEDNNTLDSKRILSKGI